MAANRLARWVLLVQEYIGTDNSSRFFPIDPLNVAQWNICGSWLKRGMVKLREHVSTELLRRVWGLNGKHVSKPSLSSRSHMWILTMTHFPSQVNKCFNLFKHRRLLIDLAITAQAVAITRVNLYKRFSGTKAFQMAETCLINLVFLRPKYVHLANVTLCNLYL